MKPTYETTTGSTTRIAKINARLIVPSFPRLEVEVLERVGGAPEEVGSGLAVAREPCDVSLRRPNRGPVAHGRQAREALVGGGERHLRVVEAALLGQRAAEHELRVPDLVDEVVAAGEQLERVARLRLGDVRLARAEVDLGERRDRLRRVGGGVELERGRDGTLQVLDRLLLPSEQEVEPAEVVEQPAGALAVADALEDLARLLGVEAREQRLAGALRDVALRASSCSTGCVAGLGAGWAA